MALQIEFQAAHIYSLAFQQNQYPLITLLAIKLDAEDEPQKDIKVTLKSDPEFFESIEWNIDYLAPGERIELQLQSVRISVQSLDELTDKIITNLSLKATTHDKLLDEKIFNSTFMPKTHWGGESQMPELLAAFSLPNSPYIEELVVKASQLLRASNLPSQLDGYQSQTREKPYSVASALWAVVQSENISYINPSPSFAISGQRIRITQDIGKNKSGACLDLSLLFASLLERVGLNPIIALTHTHAFVGVWLIDECFSSLTMDDSMAIRKRVSMKDLIVFETTLVCSDAHVSFFQSCDEADLLLGEGNEDNFVYAIDIAQARKRQISPLPIRVQSEDPESSIQETQPQVVAIAPPPPMPPVKPDDISIQPDTPETRVEQWQRKLLDLTKRNRLLNLSSNAVAVHLYCPDLGLLEDMLAAGETFQFIASDNTPLKQDNDGRSQEIFKFETGNNLQVEFAREQLDRQTLIVNDSKKKMDSRLLSLYRKAKTDFEEGGSNTLFLSIGMLRWKEGEKLDKSYRAPLILLPVELVRSSARSSIKIRQIKDEEPIFNATLIEFLQQDFEINLNIFRIELPEDDSGIDVNGIWNTVRQKIKDVPGFEVVEDLVLSTFSFAKYLMWRDLKDRVNDLKSNVFVEHLIDKPQDVFRQQTRFIQPEEVDNKIKPSDIYAPLNADSSQLVAIEASSHAQDFVMEGPPGTGKSETISNIICHNLALGRRVLFVAEKMAALNVVYRRLHKVGISHLCLELHSNKANKTAVLEQLRKSWQGRQVASQSDWERKAEELFRIRNDLNQYVEELHKPSELGITPRNAIARTAKYREAYPINLNWGNSLDACAISTKEEYELCLDAAKNLGLAYKDLEGIDAKSFNLIDKNDWSNAWQAELIANARKLVAELSSICETTTELLTSIELLPNQSLSLNGVKKACAFGKFIGELKNKRLGIVFSGNVREHLENLNRLIQEKSLADKLLIESGAELKLDVIENLPTESWITKLSESNEIIWPFSAFKRMSLRSDMKKAGVKSYKDVEVANTLNSLKIKCNDIKSIIDPFIKDKIWNGWDTRPTDLDISRNLISERSNLIKILIHEIGIEPIHGIKVLQKQFDNEWEFLDSNISLISKAAEIESAGSSLNTILNSFKELSSVSLSNDVLVKEVINQLDDIVRNERKINAWCNWLSAKSTSSKYGLDAISNGLERNIIAPDDSRKATIIAIHKWLAPILIDRSAVLRQFSATSHESLIMDFCKLDEEVSRTTSEFIIAKTASLVPEPGAKDTPVAFGVLSKELAKKSRHKPIRHLIEEMGEAMLNLTPCMMMSPLSVAQFLPTSFSSFDLVVFDEASQITVWDAVGALARGKNSIIVGDPKQMPPTNFFSRSTDGDDDEDLESILDQSLAARLPHHRLTGHYRSRHESLIAFSNSHYYDNSLITYPSAETKKSAVSFHPVKGLYSKGKNRNNPIEAKEVADYIVQRLEDDGLRKLSIGVVALNTEQQRTIEDELDTRRRLNPDIERYFQGFDDYDPIFIKNLESVQGDERDVIILSIGYGPVEPNAKTMSMNFGPLNKQGGERRLNVAITRATTEVIVFASFNPSMIDLTRTQSTAVKHLKSFLEFAEQGPSALAKATEAIHGIDQFDSDFEEAVAYQLRNCGWQIQTQIGVGKFRIDMGVVHPDFPGRYIAGIECDGATYHGSPAARDRDRVRQAILESLGWNIIRIWSTDYFIDPEGSIDKVNIRLSTILEKIRNEESSEVDADITEKVVSGFVDVSHGQLDKNRFFDESYSTTVIAVIKDVLQERNGIYLNEVISEVSRKFGLARATSQQQKYVTELLKPWAGLSYEIEDNPTVWLNKESVVDIIDWRGLAPFGVPRKWQDICFHEQLGAVKFALTKNKIKPNEALKDIFNLSRLNKSTNDEFEKWVENFRNYKQKILQ